MKLKNISSLIICVTVMLTGLSVNAQALLSTHETPLDSVDESAMLALVSDNSGLLVPTIALIYDEGEIAAPVFNGRTIADGLIIYHNGSNDISKGLWYYDAEVPEWVLYTDFTSEYAERDIDDFGELFESNELGEGTPYVIEDTYHKPWSSATVGLCGSAFVFHDSVMVTTEIGTDYADRYEITGPDAMYSIVISATLAASAPSTTVTGALFMNDQKVAHLFFRHTFQNKDKPTSLNTSGNLEIHTNDIIDFRFISDVKNKGIEIENLNIRLSKLSDL